MEQVLWITLLDDDGEGGIIPPVPTSRITEDADDRITEDTDLRITE